MLDFCFIVKTKHRVFFFWNVAYKPSLFLFFLFWHLSLRRRRSSSRSRAAIFARHSEAVLFCAATSRRIFSISHSLRAREESFSGRSSKRRQSGSATAVAIFSLAFRSAIFCLEFFFASSFSIFAKPSPRFESADLSLLFIFFRKKNRILCLFIYLFISRSGRA